MQQKSPRTGQGKWAEFSLICKWKQCHCVLKSSQLKSCEKITVFWDMMPQFGI